MTNSSNGAAALAIILTAFIPGVAHAHATLEITAAKPNSSYKGVVRIGHGCDGSATRTVRVRIPEGVIVVKPMPKAGWTLQTVKGDYGKTYDYFGTPTGSGVKEVVWSGNELPDDQYDEFVFSTRIADVPAAEPLYFPIVQECVQGAHHWVEIPAVGQKSADLKEPAPFVRLAGTEPAGPAVRAGALTITQPWSRETPAGAKVGGGYFRVENGGATADRLVRVESEVAGVTEIHEMKMDGGIMRMRPLEAGLEIPAGGAVTLAPGGFHIMFEQLKSGLVSGQTVPAVLTFEKAGRVPVTFRVGGKDAGGAAAAGGEEHNH